MTDRLTDLEPAMQIIARDFLVECKAIPINVEIIVTWRDPQDQEHAKECGLSNAGPGQSPHNCVIDGNPASRAFDFAVFENNGTYVTNGEDPRYAQAACIGKGLGLAWGGDWTHPDWDHLEINNWRTLTT